MKWKIFIISVIAVVMLFFGGILYYASHKINGEELRKLMISSLEKSFPHAEVNVGRVGFRFGKSLNLAVEGFSLSFAENNSFSQSNLFKIERVGIEIPFGVLFGLEQNITIHLDGSLVNFVKLKGESNWFKAMDRGTKSSQDVPVGEGVAPTFLANGKINLKFTDTRLSYNLEEEQKGEVLVKYFRVNNLGLKSHAAYELNSDISLKFSEQRMDMELSLVGQFSPNEFVQQGVLKTKSILTVGKIYFPSRDIAIPGFKTDVEFELSQRGEITTKLATILNDKNRINALIKTRKRELSVEDIDVVFYLNELLDIMKLDMPSLRVGDGRIELKGDIFLGAQFRPEVTFSIGPQVKYSYNNMLFSGELKGKYQGKTLVAGITSKGLSGSLYGDFSIDIDVGKQPIVLSQLPPFKFSIMANDLIVPDDAVRSILYAEPKDVSAVKEKKERKIFLLPRGSIDFNFKNISLGGEPLSLEGGIVVANKKLESKKKIRLTTSNGSGVISFKNRLYREGSKGRFLFELNSVELKDIGIFFPKWMGTMEGLSFGSIEGGFGNLNNKFTYNVGLDFKTQNGYWHGLDLNQYTQNIIAKLSKIPSLKKRVKGKKLKFNNKFQNLSLKGVFADDRWSLERYSYVDKDLRIKGKNGRIYPPPTKKMSVLSMEVDWNILSPVMSKNFSLNSLPLRLSGVGFSLQPDISFVTKALAKNQIKKHSEKVIKNLKNSLKDKKVKGVLKDLL